MMFKPEVIKQKKGENRRSENSRNTRCYHKTSKKCQGKTITEGVCVCVVCARVCVCACVCVSHIVTSMHIIPASLWSCIYYSRYSRSTKEI